MLRANSLFYATVVALIIAIVSGSLILISYYNRMLLDDDWTQERVQLNAFSGINVLMADEEMFNSSNETVVDLFDEGSDSVWLKKSNWGLFEIAVAKAFHRNHQAIQIAQLGYAPDSTTNTALYLVDQNKSLSLCGKTLIKGDCYLPEAGVKRAYIEGQSFVGTQLINGTVRKSNKELPPMDEKLIQDNLKFLTDNFLENDSVTYFANDKLPDSLSQSFADKTIFIYDDKNISLISGIYSGNIVFKSGKSVFIGAGVKLFDVLIFAKNVTVEKGFEGIIQIFATDSVKIGDGCKLKYPSAICLIRTPVSPEEPFINIGSNTEIGGIVMLFQEEQSLKYPKLTIAEKSVIRGQVFANGAVELKGNIFGNLTCTKLSLQTPSSIYENHLLNATIDYTALSKHFVGSKIFASFKSKALVKWLY